MATHTGQLFIDRFVKTFLTLSKNVSDYSVAEAIVIFGPLSKQLKKDTSKNIFGFNPGNLFAVDQLLERFHIFEQIFNLGMITQDLLFNLSFWNSSEKNNRTLTEVNEITPAGTAFVFGNIPQIFFPECEKIYKLYIYEQGPPFQETTYNCVLPPTVFSIEIIGKRIEAINSRWLFNPNWKDTIDISYIWKSVIEKNNSFYEQRRPLYFLAQREQLVSFLFEEQNAQKLYQDLLRFSSLVLVIPVFGEQLKPVFPILGETTIQFNNFENYYNLQNLTRYCIFGVLEDDLKVEVKEIDSINIINSEITFKYPVLKDFPENLTLVFPVYLGSIEDFRLEAKTDTLIKTRLKLREEKFV